MGKVILPGGSGAVKVIAGKGIDSEYFAFDGDNAKVTINQDIVDHVVCMCGISFRSSSGWGVYFEYDGETKTARYLDRGRNVWVTTENAGETGFPVDTGYTFLDGLERYIMVVKG